MGIGRCSSSELGSKGLELYLSFEIGFEGGGSFQLMEIGIGEVGNTPVGMSCMNLVKWPAQGGQFHESETDLLL